MITSIFILISIPAAVWGKLTEEADAGLLHISSEQVCFFGLGCFNGPSNILTKFGSILIPAPESPEKINTRFFLQTQTDRQPFEVRAADHSMVLNSSFNPSKPVKFLIHGYRPGAVHTWPFEMSQDILDVDDVNCFSVNWEDGAGIRYEQAVSNARVVGVQIAQFKASLEEMYQTSQLDVHFIGHSLGAHVAAFAGQTEGCDVQRISGLDTAGPLFQGATNDKRLDSSDAELVDALYTDAPTILPIISGLGTNDVSGDLNFYANGGSNQPGCERTVLLKILNPTEIHELSCSHSRAVDLYRESIRNPTAFLGHRADSYEDYRNGDRSSCDGGCAYMGYHLDVPTPTPGNFYFTTGEEPPYSDDGQ
ncbi:pancreatic triacylglycerol lipase-like [Dendrobates tinctorius]|uniref:pancreatic triacylglycerol lipase-like n=1 Tax=Dendrobates tinctorius TaxID=92724 RepID=UPI003CCA2E24